MGGEVREGYASVGDQRLHYTKAGKGPLIVLLTVTRSLFLAITRAMFTFAGAVRSPLTARPATYSVTFRRPAATSASSCRLGHLGSGAADSKSNRSRTPGPSRALSQSQ